MGKARRTPEKPVAIPEVEEICGTCCFWTLNRQALTKASFVKRNMTAHLTSSVCCRFPQPVNKHHMAYCGEWKTISPALLKAYLEAL